ncbi:CHAT domain-containing protein [Coleofasciculus sp.]|uniref:CHAT domain-containing protein n=1 Tax=Coleofasciculus sp. TaxID=3100458 RepID=UPI004063BD61
MKSNLDKLDDKFSQMLRSWAKAELLTVEPEEAQTIAGLIHDFCTYIAQFPLIKPEIKWEIVITGCQVATTVFTREASPKYWLMSQNLLGIAYCNQGRIDEAIATLESALKIYPPEVFFTRFRDEWTMLQNRLGNAYWSRSQSQESPEEKLRNLNLALAAYEKALQGTPKDESPDDWAGTKYNICDVYGKMGKTADAIICYKQALEVFPEKTYEWAQTQHGLGLTYSEERNIDQAIDCFRLALKIFTPTAYPEDCRNIGRSLGYVALGNRRWQEAIEGYGIAIEALEQQINIWATTDAQRQKTQQSGIDLSCGMVKACINDGQLTKAIEYVERNKARNLVKFLASENLEPKGVSEDIRNQCKRLRQEISKRQNLLDMRDVQNRESDESHRTQLNQFQEEINKLKEQLDSFIVEKIQPHDPSFNLTQQVKGILFEEIQALLPDNQTALIEWYILDDIFVTFIITHQSPGITVWKSDPQDIEAFKLWGNEYFQDYGKSSKQAWRDHLESYLSRLAEILHLDEILTHVPDTCDRIILIPHQSLHVLPLHALPLLHEKGKCLLDKFPRGVHYAPSCQVLQLAQSRQRPDFTHLFAIQNPTKDLDYSDIEVQAIKQYFHSSHILVKGDAKKSAIDNQQLQTAHCIHFSCHGDFDFERPLLSKLHLADCHISPKNDPATAFSKYLTVLELFTFDLSQCRLVTLSACETGLIGFPSATDEYIGLNYGFLVAGTASIVCSLWTVNDISTALLIIRFYQNLKSGLTVPIALNQAQTWLRDATKEELQQWVKQLSNPNHRMQLRAFLNHKPPNSKPFESPYHWAAFCAIGQ